jgi:uncharacterized membrane protein
MADKNEAYHLAAVQFSGKDRAAQVVDLVKSKQKAGDYKLKAWAVVEVDQNGKAKVSQSGSGGKGAAIGGGAGALLGLIGGPAGLIAWALGGALLGGLAGKYAGQQFNADNLKAIGAAMAPNTSGIIVVVEDTMMQKLADDMGMEGGQLMSVTLGDQISGSIASVEAIGLGEAGEADSSD